jgi:hypothetical protein
VLTRLPRWTLIVALLFASPALAEAQELASSFDQLRVLIKAGDRLTIVDSTGQELRGRMTRLSSSVLEVDTDGRSRTLGESEVRTIRLRHSDTLANGAKWGFGAGCAFGLLGAIAISDEVSDGALPMFVAIYGAFGAGVGVGIDGLVKSNDVIYSRPGTGSRAWSISPAVGRRGAGVRLAIGFGGL